MNDPHRAEKLALARKKLKEFENKRKTDDGRCSSLSNGSVQSMDRLDAEREPFQVVTSNGSYNLHIDRQTNASSVSSINSSVVMTNGVPMEEAAQIMTHPYSSAIEARLVQERDGAIQAYEQTKQQLSDLHGHYAHLHAAYSHMSSNRAHSELESQVLQLQSAVSVLVEEKTTLQAELRIAREQCEQIATSHIKVQADAVQFQTEQELRNLRQKLEQALALTAAQATELEQQRRINAETQARAMSVQNEKSEAQLRVKALLKERDAQNEELTAVRKDLQMKSLHLKQLTKHQSQSPDETAAASDQIRAITERLEALTSELLAVKTERDAVLKDSESSTHQFERYTTELSERNGSLRQELEATEAQRSFFESRAQELEMQLTYLQQSAVPSETAPTQIDHAQVEEQLKKIRSLEEKLSETTSKLLTEKKEAGEQIERYSSVVAMKNEEVLNMSIKLRQLEERITETRASESELLLLSEQLQSEKATVSRAVAQNKELKEQLLETEDRIFVLTNEKMQMEMDKEAAEHQVRVLTDQLAQNESHNSSSSQEDSEHLEANEAEALAMRTEKEHELQQKLAQALHELADTRQELRQSQGRNEQMNQIMMNNAEDENQNSIHVELGHAMTRVNQLATENEQLRESLSELQRRESELTDRLTALPAVETAMEAAESPILERRERKESEVQEDVVDETEPVLSFPQNYSGPKLEQWARVELEKKFTESMRRNAELSDNLDKIEHINEQLQMENETIGDHVILYHQQRKIIQDRLRLKDQQLLAMEAEKQRVVERCRELQMTLKEVLTSKDLPSASPLNRSIYRTYSHSTIDEMTGDEALLVSEENASQVECPTSQKDGEVVYREEGRMSPQLEGTEAKVQRIFNILDEISTTPVKSADDMHCSHCIGELKKL